jgi:hypothetical protein
MPYEPPKTIWSVAEKLDFNEPLGADDERFVPTAAARGEFRFDELLKLFGVDGRASPWRLRALPSRTYTIFCGHRGCGKSTELRRLAADLHQPNLFWVCYMDALTQLDVNNLQYPDVLMAVARRLCEMLEAAGIGLDRALLRSLENWFAERVQTDEKTREFAVEVKAGADAKAGLPFLGKLFAEFTNAFRTNATYKEELRRVIANSFSQFAQDFNQFIQAAEQAVVQKGLAQKLLIVVDGTDKLPYEAGHRFFVQDADRLLQLESNFIYSVPIDLLYREHAVLAHFKHTKLPMIKLETPDGRRKVEAGYQALRALLLKRADASLFDSRETMDYLIQYSGGHPRDLLKLLFYAYQKARGEQFDRPAAEAAVRALATDYRHILDDPDYRLLFDIDRGRNPNSNSERVHFLLFNQALLEYNSYWRRSHPVVRTLEGYQRLAARKPTARHASKRKATRSR